MIVLNLEFKILCHNLIGVIEYGLVTIKLTIAIMYEFYLLQHCSSAPEMVKAIHV